MYASHIKLYPIKHGVIFLSHSFAETVTGQYNVVAAVVASPKAATRQSALNIIFLYHNVAF